MRRLLGIVLALAGGLLALHVAAASPCETRPPAQADNAAPWIADFDGDGRPDRLWLLPPGSRPGDRSMVSDPWRRARQPLDPDVLALVVDRGERCLLIQNRRFFATPIWEAGAPLLRVLARGSSAARPWRSVARGWRGDGVLLGTEAGVELLLYWDGRRPRIALGRDAP